MSENKSKRNVGMLLGDYRVAVRKMAGPMILNMLIVQSYNLIDGVWVSFLGSDALAAVGFVTALFIILNGLSNGLGAGVTSLISRRIGAKDKEGADRAATQSILASTVIIILISVVILVLQKPILYGLGAGSVYDLAASYNTIIFIGAVFVTLSAVLAGILRAEGDVKRAVYALIFSSILNIILDPIFIFYFNMGVAGAALATILSSFVSVLIIAYWLLVKSDTFVDIKVKYIKPHSKTIAGLLAVGIPAALEFMCISFNLGIANKILSIVGSAAAVATYTAGIRVVLFGIVPTAGLATAVIAVAGAAFGGEDYVKLKNVLNYATKLGVLIALLTASIIFIFAEQIALLFSFSPQTALLVPDIALMLRVMSLFFLFTPLGSVSGSFFQSMGRGLTSLILGIFRDVIFAAIFMSLFALVFHWGSMGVWAGVVAGKIVGATIGWIYANFEANKLIRKNKDI